MRYQVLWLMLGVTAMAQQAQAQEVGGRYAIVVGYNQASDPNKRPLRFADDDAVQYANLFRQMGIDTQLLVELDEGSRRLYPETLINGAPDRPQLAAAIDRVRQSMGKIKAPGSRLFFVYAGHGDVADGEGFLNLSDGRFRRSDLFREVLDRSPAEINHVLIDACYSYFMVFERGQNGERSEFKGGFDQRPELHRYPQTGFLLSTSSSQISHEWEAFQGGVFSHEVRSALRGASDLNGDRRISYQELAGFVDVANAAIPNEKYRPKFLVAPPVGDDVFLELPGPEETVRTLEIQGKPNHHFTVETEFGVRLVDVRPGTQGVSLVLPSGHLFVRDQTEDVEYNLKQEGAIALSSVASRPATISSRGSADVSFRLIFAEPFDRAAFGQVDLTSLLVDRELSVVSERPSDRWSSLPLIWGGSALSVALAGLGVGLRVTADRRFDRYTNTVGQDRSGMQNQVRELDMAAWTAFGVAGAAAITTLVLYLALDED